MDGIGPARRSRGLDSTTKQRAPDRQRSSADAVAQQLANLPAGSEPAARERLAAELREAGTALKALSRPLLEWAGKAERLSFEVPTLPLFIHERLSTQAILDSLKSYTGGQMALNFGGHPDRDLAEQLLKAYEYPDGWFNRMILGDSLVVINSLLQYEHLAGQLQMIYFARARARAPAIARSMLVAPSAA